MEIVRGYFVKHAFEVILLFGLVFLRSCNIENMRHYHHGEEGCSNYAYSCKYTQLMKRFR